MTSALAFARLRGYESGHSHMTLAVTHIVPLWIFDSFWSLFAVWSVISNTCTNCKQLCPLCLLLCLISFNCDWLHSTLSAYRLWVGFCAALGFKSRHSRLRKTVQSFDGLFDHWAWPEILVRGFGSREHVRSGIKLFFLSFEAAVSLISWHYQTNVGVVV